MDKANRITDKLRSYYQEKQPDLLDPQISLDWVNMHGWESEIYAYTLSYGLPGSRAVEKQVIRLLTGADDASAKREYEIYEILNKAAYPVPQVYGLGSTADGFGHPFIIMACIEEQTKFSSRFPRSQADDLEPLYQFARLFRRLHLLNWEEYTHKWQPVDLDTNPYFYFDNEIELYETSLHKADIWFLDPVFKWLQENRIRAGCRHSSIIHFDFHPDNILQDKDGKLFVVDWSSAEISDYRFDLGWTLTLALAYGGETRRMMILDSYESVAEQRVPALDVFEVAAIVRRLGTVMISLQAGPESLGMRAEAAEVMRRDLEPLNRIYQQLQGLTGMSLPRCEAWLNGLEA